MTAQDRLLAGSLQGARPSRIPPGPLPLRLWLPGPRRLPLLGEHLELLHSHRRPPRLSGTTSPATPLRDAAYKATGTCLQVRAGGPSGFGSPAACASAGEGPPPPQTHIAASWLPVCGLSARNRGLAAGFIFYRRARNKCFPYGFHLKLK